MIPVLGNQYKPSFATCSCGRSKSQASSHTSNFQELLKALSICCNLLQTFAKAFNAQPPYSWLKSWNSAHEFPVQHPENLEKTPMGSSSSEFSYQIWKDHSTWWIELNHFRWVDVEKKNIHQGSKKTSWKTSPEFQHTTNGPTPWGLLHLISKVFHPSLSQSCLANLDC